MFDAYDEGWQRLSADPHDGLTRRPAASIPAVDDDAPPTAEERAETTRRLRLLRQWAADGRDDDAVMRDLRAWTTGETR